MRPNSALFATTMAIIDTIKEWLAKSCIRCGKKLIDRECFNYECSDYYGGVKAQRERKLKDILND